jgi:phosphoglucosamine mutase
VGTSEEEIMPERDKTRGDEAGQRGGAEEVAAPEPQGVSQAARRSATRRLFGTDGIRGTANREPVTAETALRVAMAAGLHFTRGEHRHLVVIGKDTRLSGYMLEPALTAGFIAMGMDVALTGPLPTPAVAMLTRSMRADLGVVISASHNPFEDNGIKLFGPDGTKLSDEIEARIEAMMDEAEAHRASPRRLGRARRLEDATGRYTEFAKQAFPREMRLDGLRVVVDCANGAAYRVAPTVLYELGAEVIAIGDKPDGLNINQEVGATSPEALRQEVRARRADLGLALDGDADRLIVCDERGEVLDGDQMIGLVAADWHENGRLRGGAVVTTVMSNLGLERFLEARGLKLHRTKVGDRYVLEGMVEHGCNIGGEQSGHIIMSDHSTTGDGIIAALQVLAAIVPEGRRVSEVARVFTPLPQRLRSVRFGGGAPLGGRARPAGAAVGGGSGSEHGTPPGAPVGDRTGHTGHGGGRGCRPGRDSGRRRLRGDHGERRRAASGRMSVRRGRVVAPARGGGSRRPTRRPVLLQGVGSDVVDLQFGWEARVLVWIPHPASPNGQVQQHVHGVV